jgi:hypothetical protein
MNYPVSWPISFCDYEADVAVLRDYRVAHLASNFC